MTHRVEQIVDAAVEAIKLNASPLTGEVYRYRVLQLDENFGEIPATSVLFGVDEPADDDGAENLAVIDSIVEVFTVAYLTAQTEEEFTSKLLEARVTHHKAMMANDRTLNLPFVMQVSYGGASEPDVGRGSDVIVGAIASRWLVHYRMNITDPS